jgi:2-hydroxy-6-oxonona-2,4-dienedioate hydrolase
MKTIRLKSWILGLIGVSLIIPSGLIYHHYQVDMAQAYQRVSSGGKLIETACGSIQYAEFGEGAPVLVVHGTGGGYDQGITLAETLGGNFHWIAPSRFGYLGSPVPEGADSALQADAYACLLDTLGIERVAVVGYSAGGPSSLLFALRYPQRVTSLTILSAVSHPIPARSGAMETMYRGFVNDFFYWSFVHASRENLLAALGVPVSDQKKFPPEEVAQAYAVLDQMLPMGARRNGLIFDFERMSSYDAEQIAHIQAPTLVMHARNDSLVPFEQAEFTASKVPGAQFMPLQKGGHFALLFNAPARAKVVDFIQQHNP